MKKKTVIDQIGRKVTLPVTPQRVISVVPSITEFLVDIGIADRLVGSTLFCIHPKSLKKDTKRIGGTKTLNLDKIKNLCPDLIIANKEENNKDQINELSKITSVWISDIKNIDDALNMIKSLGEILELDEKAILLSNKIEFSFKEKFIIEEKSCIYLIWRDPYMSVGNDTFIHHMLVHAGFKNLLSNKTRYPKVTIDEIEQLKPEYLLLSTEPFPFKEKHVKEMQAILPASKILIVDGELFSWYGSRLLKSVDYFKSLHH